MTGGQYPLVIFYRHRASLIKARLRGALSTGMPHQR